MSDFSRVSKKEETSRFFPTLICAATSWEAFPIAQALHLKAASSDSFFGKFGGRSILLIKTGMGEAALKKRLSQLPEGGVFSRVISTGFCGALKPELSTGDIICDGLPEVLSAKAEIIKNSLGLKVYFSPLAHAEEALYSPKLKKSFADKTGALVVDMESSPLKFWAKEKNPDCEFASIRVVLDSLEDSLPAQTPQNEKTLSFIWYFISQPRSWANFGKLYLKQRRASKILVDFLRRLLDDSGDLK